MWLLLKSLTSRLLAVAENRMLQIAMNLHVGCVHEAARFLTEASGKHRSQIPKAQP